MFLGVLVPHLCTGERKLQVLVQETSNADIEMFKVKLGPTVSTLVTVKALSAPSFQDEIYKQTVQDYMEGKLSEAYAIVSAGNLLTLEVVDSVSSYVLENEKTDPLTKTTATISQPLITIFHPTFDDVGSLVRNLMHLCFGNMQSAGK